MKPTLSALASGALFGAGLALAQMTNPAKVIGFLDVAGSWDASLGLVMGAALLVSAIGTRVYLARGAAATPTGGVDARLLVGASLFGIGWGLAGLCPGPAIAALVTGSWEVALFAVSMLVGMGLFRFSAQGRGREASGRAQEAREA